MNASSDENLNERARTGDDPAVGATLYPQILRWARGRASEIVDTRSGRSIWFINVFSGQTEQIQDIEDAGFASQADVGLISWTKVKC